MNPSYMDCEEVILRIKICITADFAFISHYNVFIL